MPEATTLPDLTDVGLVGTDRGYDLVGFIHDPRTDTYVVLLHRPYRNLDPYVVGRVGHLQDREWSNGNYLSNYPAAVRTLISRAGMDA
jgi:hypothetical protein